MSEHDYYQSASQLMKAIGEPKGIFDATPPRLHDSLQHFRETEKIRILSLLLAHTVRNGPKGMSPCARDAQGHRLTETQIGRLLHIKKQNVGPAIRELIAEGKIAKDKSGGFCVRGDVAPPELKAPDHKGRRKGVNGNLYKLLPDYIKPRFQQLTEIAQNRFLADLEAIADWEHRAHRESFGVIREQSTQFRGYLFASIDVKAKKLERKKEKRPKPELLDRLKVKPPQLQSVQITLDFEFVQDQNGHSYELQKDSVQNAHPLVTEIETEINTPPTPPLAAAREGSGVPNPPSKTEPGSPEGKRTDLWPDFFLLTRKGKMSMTGAERERCEQDFRALTTAEQIAAGRGIQVRLDSREYDPDDSERKRYIPTVRNYLLGQLWQRPERPPAKKNKHDTSVLDLVDQGMSEEEALRIVEERNGKRKFSTTDHPSAEGGGYAG